MVVIIQIHESPYDMVHFVADHLMAVVQYSSHLHYCKVHIFEMYEIVGRFFKGESQILIPIF